MSEVFGSKDGSTLAFTLSSFESEDQPRDDHSESEETVRSEIQSKSEREEET